MLLGLWAARHRVLEEPGRHLQLPRRTAAAGIALGWAGGLPLALTHSPDAPVVWLITVIAAYALERRGSRGPAEVALRHLIGKPEVTREG